MIRELRLKLQGDLKALQHELVHELPQEIKRALAMGDLRENAEYHSALARQSYVKARILQISQRLADLASFNLAAVPKDRVGLGSKVTVLDLVTETEITYKVVMNDDADIDHGKISVGSPIARGLSGKRVGDAVTIEIPSGTKRFEIIELITMHDEEASHASAGAGGGANDEEDEGAPGEEPERD